MARVGRRRLPQVRKVIAVSEADSRTHQELFGLRSVPRVRDRRGRGIADAPRARGSWKPIWCLSAPMDWMPNIDGVVYFLDEILPLIRRKRPDCTVTIVGRYPPAALSRRAESDRNCASPAPCRTSGPIFGAPRFPLCRFASAEERGSRFTNRWPRGRRWSPPDRGGRSGHSPARSIFASPILRRAFAEACLDCWPTRVARAHGPGRLGSGVLALFLGAGYGRFERILFD